MFIAWVALTIVSPWAAYSWATRCFPRLAAARWTVAWALGGTAALQWPLGWLALHAHSKVASAMHSALAIALIATALALSPLAAFHVIRRGWLRMRPPGPDVTALTDTGAARRRVVEGVIGATFLGTTGSMLGWGLVRGRHDFQLREVAVRIPGLPRSLDGYAIVQISDLHTGQFVGEGELDLGLQLVRRARADLVVVTGDLVDFEPEYAPMVARKLADLPNRDGIFGILGNHDYFTGSAVVRAAMQRAGVELLVNASRVIRPSDGRGFALLGVDDLSASRYGGVGPNLVQAASALPPELPRILLSHQPQTIDRWPGQVALQLSGHTHGGQINPGFRVLDLLMPYVQGRYEVGGTTLYVNAGFGTVGPPTRVCAAPEVTRVVLVA